ncbi:MAG: ATP-binding cassette domain-containing protein [Candidatus Nanopelagicales bacterium]|nr:ATP-binding cassette domain-containing protein [Candidatus Nanopelagicales bacterium]MDZ4249872.1 ATP-binding cassette domain-containing protein [Candidatus Nanopelagicales bacterium]
MSPELFGGSGSPTSDTIPLEVAADAALREILTPSGMDVIQASGSDVVDALVVAAAASGFHVSPARTAQVGRGEPTDVMDAARRIGVPTRAVALKGRWWRRDSGPYIVQCLDGRVAAAVPRGRSYVLVLDARATRLDDGIAASLSPRAWSVTPRLPDEATGLRELVKASVGTSFRSDIVIALGAAVCTAVLGIAVPALSGYVVGDLVDRGAGARTVAIGLLLVMVALAAAGLILLQSLLLQGLTTRLNSRMVAALLDRVVRLPLSFFRAHSVGDLVQRIQGLDQVGFAVTTSLLRITSGLLLAVSGFAVMFVVSPALAWMVCAALFATGLVVVTIMYRQVQARERYVGQALELSGTTLSLFTGIAKIKVAGAETRMQALWTLTYARQQQAARDAARGVQRLSLVAALAPVLVTVVVVLGSIRASNGLPLGAFTSFIAAAGQSAGALAALLGPMNVVVGAIPVLKAVRVLLAARPEPLGSAAADPVLEGGVELAEVSFKYDETGPDVLSHVSLQVAPGEFVAIAGPSGAGKSTLLRVLIGLEVPTSGEVLFDGRPLERLGSDSIRRQIGAVAQSAELASGTILDNIIGASPLTESDAWAAAELAGIAADIRAMPMGMRTFVSDGAATFSGGQKQRIMLARALVRNPRILLLDEATSALDNRTQAAVGDSMRALGATRIVVAHRLTTIRDADRIYVVDGGRIVEHGSYEELMRRRGVFFALAARQLSA